jgi:hypothetical protein
MAGLQFIHLFTPTASILEQRVIAGEVVPSDPRPNVQTIVINIPTKILSRVFSFEREPCYGTVNRYGGRLKIDFLPLKEYLDVLDIKLLSKTELSFYDDKRRPNIIVNLTNVSNSLSFSANDPLSKLPASAILSTSITDLVKDSVYVTLSSGPIDTDGNANSYDAITDLFNQAIAAGMIEDDNGNLFPFTDMFTVNFIENSSLSIRLNYSVSKNRTYQYWNNEGAPLTGTIKIGNVEISLSGPNGTVGGYTNSTITSYTIQFVSSDNPSNFAYAFTNTDARVEYDKGVLATQIINETRQILNETSGVTFISQNIDREITLIYKLKNAYEDGMEMKGSTAANNEETLILTGFRYIQHGITLAAKPEVDAEYSRLMNLVGITGDKSYFGDYNEHNIYSQNQTIWGKKI